MSEIVKWVLVSFIAFNAVACVLAVGKPRQPMTAGSAATIVIVNAAVIVAVLAYWRPA